MTWIKAKKIAAELEREAGNFIGWGSDRRRWTRKQKLMARISVVAGLMEFTGGIQNVVADPSAVK